MSSKMRHTLKTDIKELTHEQLISWLKARGIAAYRAAQILKRIYHQPGIFGADSSMRS